ncbi:arginine deiminase [Fastidiosibacter lacustris]|uniref:arginine deiminase n=1 Tax=Fastidiosibacter lacustris TaxID=2056695 RepID=UPI00195E5A60|nr:arginine deiminase [Fastidiosibacter lacustris]
MFYETATSQGLEGVSMPDTKIDLTISSEIAPLKTILLKRPGKELCNLTPNNLEELLFDDIPYLENAQKEHDVFANILRQQGVEVLYLEDLAGEVLDNQILKAEIINTFLGLSGIRNVNIVDGLRAYLSQYSGKELCQQLMSGLKRNEIKLSDMGLSTQIARKDDFWLHPIPNLYFTRDPGVVFGNMACLNSMYAETRRRESIFIESVLKHHSRFSRNLTLDLRLNHGSIEGGDIIVLDKNTLAIGVSQRTSAQAIEQLSHQLFFDDRLKTSHTIKKILAFKIPVSRAFMHLDTVLTQIDYDKVTMHRGIVHKTTIYRLSAGDSQTVKCDELTGDIGKILSEELSREIEIIYCGGEDTITGSREQWSDGANTLALRPGEVFVYQRNAATNRLLQEKGIKVYEIPCSELSRGRGGATLYVDATRA